MKLQFIVLVVAVSLALSCVSVAEIQRQPVAIVAIEKHLVVGNRTSGTLSLIDADTMRVVAEYKATQQIADMVRHPKSNGVLILDDSRNFIVHASFDAGKLHVDDLSPISPSSTKLIASDEQIVVASRWTRAVTIVRLDQAFKRQTRLRRIQLPFPPHEMLLFNDQKSLLVAGAFKGQLAVIDLAQARLRNAPKQLDGHNIRGMALSADERHIFVSHQRLNSIVQTDFDGIHWGNLMKNMVTKIEIEKLLEPRVKLQRGHEEQLGLSGSATGDPGAIFVSPGGQRAVALSGINEVAVTGRSFSHRVAVGRRPVAMTMVGERLFVANQFDDSVSVIEMGQGRGVKKISLGDQPKLSSIERGERLFFDARLSHDGWMSCHSCHSDGHTMDGLADTLGDGNYGAPKRIPSLLGTKDTAPWGWTGSAAKLHLQVKSSVETTMQGRGVTNEQTADLVAYLNTLKPPPTQFGVDKNLIEQGQRVFQSQRCATCHQSPKLTSSEIYDVGLVDERGHRQFNPPSLYGLGQRDKFFHDGRYSQIEEVLQKEKHQLNDKLSADEFRALVAFLKSL